MDRGQGLLHARQEFLCSLALHGHGSWSPLLVIGAAQKARELHTEVDTSLARNKSRSA